MFRGNHLARIDDKGRLKLPADFKRRVDEVYRSNSFYITSRDGERAQFYPMQEWEEIEQKLAKMPNSDPAKKKFVDTTNYFGQTVEMDVQGRLTLPPVLRERARLDGEVVVLGSQKIVEVANREMFEGTLKADPINAADLVSLANFGL